MEQTFNGLVSEALESNNQLLIHKQITVILVFGFKNLMKIRISENEISMHNSSDVEKIANFKQYTP